MKRGRSRSGLRGIAIVLFLGCDSPVRPGPEVRPDIRHLVTGEALAALDASGRFRRDWSRAPAGTVPLDSAAAIAEYLVRKVPEYRTIPGMISVKEVLEEAFGGHINYAAAKTGVVQPYLIESPFESLPDYLPAAARNIWGSFIALPVHVGRYEVATVIIPATGVMRLRADGSLEPRVGNDYDYAPIPWGRGSTVVLSPEDVVHRVATATGKRVSQLPRLLAPGKGTAASVAIWSVTFEDDVPVETVAGGERHHVRTVYVTQFGYMPVYGGVPTTLGAWYVFIAADVQPVTDTIHYLGEQGPASLEWPLRSGYPHAVTEVRFIER
jgi:hypothetical protein